MRSSIQFPSSQYGRPTVVELCAGGGGQTIGLEAAGFECAAAVEIDAHACNTLRLNRPEMRVIEADINEIHGNEFKGVDLLSGGLPCPPFSIAGKQLGKDDERDLFPEALRIIGEIKPRAIMLENVPGFASPKFKDYRDAFISKVRMLGYDVGWRIIQAADHGVPQLRPRFLLVGLRPEYSKYFHWPVSAPEKALTVGQTLFDLISSRGWPGALAWTEKANRIAPTIVGGSKKHGGPDLGPTRAKAQWRLLGVNGITIANEDPAPDFPVDDLPRLTVRMVARIQSFPDSWEFFGRKTAAYRQVGNAFPPLVAEAVATSIRNALEKTSIVPLNSEELASGLVSEP